MKVTTQRIVIETAILMLISFGFDMVLLTCGAPFWVAFLLTAAIFVGGDYYYQHTSIGGHDDE